MIERIVENRGTLYLMDIDQSIINRFLESWRVLVAYFLNIYSFLYGGLHVNLVFDSLKKNICFVCL